MRFDNVARSCSDNMITIWASSSRLFERSIQSTPRRFAIIEGTGPIRLLRFVDTVPDSGDGNFALPGESSPTPSTPPRGAGQVAVKMRITNRGAESRPYLGISVGQSYFPASRLTIKRLRPNRSGSLEDTCKRHGAAAGVGRPVTSVFFLLTRRLTVGGGPTGLTSSKPDGKTK